MSNQIRAEVLKELTENANNRGYNFLFASTTKDELKIHVKGDISDEDAMNVAMAILMKLASRYGVELILQTVKELI